MIDFEYYQTVYYGKLPQEEFLRCSVQAEAYMNRLTFNRLSIPYDEKVKKAFCACVDAVSVNEQGGDISSTSNDGLTVTYTKGVAQVTTNEQRIYNAISLHLAGTGLLYGGL